ncbi:hypothetical protein ACFWPA_16120 [Rhodococcus sp. NPDC058505]|uniref:hypothetical protein n=1 Tax=unclassified Rhodococcus (in: high G+C Gram-positive bacteria) TaxID=192944 RepID=UPI0036521B9D
MLVLTLAMAAVGFALLVIALMTGSVVWAWGCIVVCVVGAVLLLVSSLRGNTAPGGAPGGRDRGAGTDGATRNEFDGSD